MNNKEQNQHNAGGKVTEHPEPREASRRDVLRAVGKYTAFLAGTSTVLLTADQVLATPRPCSQITNDPSRCR